MNATLSLGTQDDLDQTMRLVARNIAMGIHDTNKILEICGVSPRDFMSFNSNPRFIRYLKSETEAWENALNVGERTKLKSGIMIEEWLKDAYGELADKKTPLSQRVELAKLVARIAGMGEQKNGVIGVSEGGGGFTLQINIGQGVHANFSNNSNLKTIDNIPDDATPELRNINTDLGIPEDE